VDAVGDIDPTKSCYMHATTTTSNATTKVNSIREKLSRNIERDVELN